MAGPPFVGLATIPICVTTTFASVPRVGLRSGRGSESENEVWKGNLSIEPAGVIIAFAAVRTFTYCLDTIDSTNGNYCFLAAPGSYLTLVCRVKSVTTDIVQRAEASR